LCAHKFGCQGPSVGDSYSIARLLALVEL
jgi:hypothetical protein